MHDILALLCSRCYVKRGSKEGYVKRALLSDLKHFRWVKKEICCCLLTRSLLCMYIKHFHIINVYNIFIISPPIYLNTFCSILHKIEALQKGALICFFYSRLSFHFSFILLVVYLLLFHQPPASHLSFYFQAFSKVSVYYCHSVALTPLLSLSCFSRIVPWLFPFFTTHTTHTSISNIYTHTYLLNR